MLDNMTVKTKLLLLLITALVAAALIGGAGWMGLRATGHAINEIGMVRLPSVQGLLVLSEGQTAVRSANRWVMTWENDYKAQSQFAEVLKARKAAWDNLERGWKIYEPLPQTEEEAVMWKQLLKEFGDWKAGDQKISEVIEALSRNNNEAEQKVLFAKYFALAAENAANFTASDATLNKIVDLNVKYGNEAVASGQAAEHQANLVMAGVGVAATIVLILLGTLIIRSILKQLGGDPIYVSRVVGEIANGDLSVQVNLQPGDSTSMLAAIGGMAEKLT